MCWLDCEVALLVLSADDIHRKSAPEKVDEQKKAREKQWKRPKRTKQDDISKGQPDEETMEDDGYDGYYEVGQPQDRGFLARGVEREQMDQVVGVAGGAVLVIAALVLLMRFLEEVEDEKTLGNYPRLYAKANSDEVGQDRKGIGDGENPVGCAG